MDNVFEALKFIFGEALFSEYKNETSNKVRECNAIVYRALTELKAIKEAKPSEAMECLKKIGEDGVFYDMDTHEYVDDTKEYYTIKQSLLKAQEQDKVLEIIKNKCLYTDNLSEVAVCINYDMYKERMSKKYDTVVVKIDWNDRNLIDYLKLLKEEEFDLLKRWQNENIRSRN